MERGEVKRYERVEQSEREGGEEKAVRGEGAERRGEGKGRGKD